MTKDRIRIVVAIGRVAGRRAAERAPKSEQRAVAAACKARLGALLPNPIVTPIMTSVSHSRAWVAVAALESDFAGGIGVDLEYADPAREWSRIVAYLTSGPREPLMPAQGALIWTSYEAVFKATGVWPTSSQVSAFATAFERSSCADGPIEHRCGSVRVFSLGLPQDAQFSLSIALDMPTEGGGEVEIEFLKYAEPVADLGRKGGVKSCAAAPALSRGLDVLCPAPAGPPSRHSETNVCGARGAIPGTRSVKSPKAPADKRSPLARFSVAQFFAPPVRKHIR